jgi:hypothetical protein
VQVKNKQYVVNIIMHLISWKCPHGIETGTVGIFYLFSAAPLTYKNFSRNAVVQRKGM